MLFINVIIYNIIALYSHKNFFNDNLNYFDIQVNNMVNDLKDELINKIKTIKYISKSIRQKLIEKVYYKL